MPVDQRRNQLASFATVRAALATSAPARLQLLESSRDSLTNPDEQYARGLARNIASKWPPSTGLNVPTTFGSLDTGQFRSRTTLATQYLGAGETHQAALDLRLFVRTPMKSSQRLTELRNRISVGQYGTHVSQCFVDADTPQPCTVERG